MHEDFDKVGFCFSIAPDKLKPAGASGNVGFCKLEEEANEDVALDKLIESDNICFCCSIVLDELTPEPKD